MFKTEFYYYSAPHMWQGYGLKGLRFKFWYGQSTASRPTLGPTQPPIQWVARVLSWGGGREPLEHKVNRAPPSSAKIRDV
jgi:hypothetical protein